MVETIFTMLGAGMIGYSGYGIKQAIEKVRGDYQITREEEYRRKIEEPIIEEYELVLGFRSFGGYKKPIIANMRNTPHMLVCGLSQQGKTHMVENAIQGKNVILMNGDFAKDFKSIKGERVSDPDEILLILKKLTDIKSNNTVTYVVIDEILKLITTKTKVANEIMDCITQLLAYSAHNNIYVIALTQCAEKEVVKNKHLYNTRVCFKMLDESAYKVVLGKNPDDLYLSKREFYYVTSEFGKGYTYDI